MDQTQTATRLRVSSSRKRAVTFSDPPVVLSKTEVCICLIHLFDGGGGKVMQKKAIF